MYICKKKGRNIKMKEIILDTLLDALKLLPFLFLAFFIIEFIEHRLTKKSKNIITKSQKLGPIIGSILGSFPQCGFSVMATNLYTTRIITLGTLIAVYLSTSDEMLPILLSEKVDIKIIVHIILIKIALGMFYGLAIDFFFRQKENKEKYTICEEEHCHCENGIILSSIKHTLNTVLFIILTSFIINVLFVYIGEDYLSKILLKDSIISPFITCLIGLIPNCGSSIILTELYLNSAISFSSFISGLLTGSGTALLILIKSNKNMKENIMIIALIYLLGAFSGVIINIIGKIL